MEKGLFFIDKKGMEECVICMELIKEVDKAVLKCGHSYHASCMFSSVVKENNTCPLCRTEVSEKPEKKPEMTVGLMRIFIQNELNRVNLTEGCSGLFESHRKWFQEHGGGGDDLLRYDDVSVEDRAYMSENVIHLLVQFGCRLGSQVNNWIREGDSRLHIPQEFTDNEPIRVPLEAYMPLQDGGAEESKEEDSESDSDMPSLMSVSEESDDDDEIEPINLEALFDEEGNAFFDIEQRLAVERSQRIMETIAVNLDSYFPDNELGESNYFIERIQGNEWLYHHLADATIEEIMWPIGGSGIRPLFTQEQAEAIFGEILRYHGEDLDP
tara:strand:- start:3155 stop:4132 length:978 start_codon:yes stop_codon:yes gene_type:complete